MIFFWIPLHKNTPNFLLLCYRRLNFFTGSLLGALPRGCNPIDLPFYRYGGHIELIRFKEYYGMPRGVIRTTSHYFKFAIIYKCYFPFSV